MPHGRIETAKIPGVNEAPGTAPGRKGIWYTRVSSNRGSGGMKQLFREPLVHFLALGAALFIWNGVGGNGAGAQNQIVVTAGQVDRLIEGWTRTWQRPPTPQEVDGMIEDYIREDVLYREAMERGGAPAGGARLLEGLRAGGGGIAPAELGDPIPLQGAFESISERDVVGFFGEGFADALIQTEVGRWTGPLESGYGLHLVFVRAMVEGRMPELTEVREAGERGWAAARRREWTEAFYQGLRDKYTVRVELPSWAEGSGTSP